MELVNPWGYDYKKADTHVMIHNWGDIGLHPIKINLPECPDYKSIPNYGLAPKDQYFRYTKLPKKLQELDATIRAKKKASGRKDFDKISDEDRWTEIYGNPVHYHRESKWIRRELKRFREGYWWFSRGKPEYMNGWCYFVLNYWPVGNDADGNKMGLPFYNRRLRDWFLAIHYTYTTTEAIYRYRVTYMKAGNMMPTKYFAQHGTAKEFAFMNGGLVEEGEFVVDKHKRLFYGVNNPKHRRTLATYGSMGIAYCVVTQHRERYGGVQSKNKESAERAYGDKFIKPWQSVPFWARPIHDGMDTPKSGMKFQFPGTKTGRRTDLTPLNGWFMPESGKESAFDGDKLHVVVQDELWKENLADVLQRINIIKPAMATGAGSNIIGLMIGISTVGEFDGGGQRFQHFAAGSHWENRDENGQTATGMMNLFFPAYYCLEGYVDMYGDPVIDDPSKPVKGIDGKMITVGAKTFIKNRIDELTRLKDWRARNKFILDHPSEWKDLFRKNVSDSSYNVDEIQEQITTLKSYRGSEQKSQRYRLEWENGVKFGKKVVAIPDPMGKHVGSFLPNTAKQNRTQYDQLYECKFPHPDVIGNFYAALDPFRLNADEKSGKSGRGSDAGFAIYYREDPMHEGERPREQWDSDNFVWAYRDRPATIEEPVEEALKACVLFGALLCGENNIPDFDRLFKSWGYAGYLLHQRDPETMKVKDLSGINTSGTMGEKLFIHFGNYLARNTKRCNIVEILDDALHVGHFKYMTDHDLFVASCIAYYAATHLDTMTQRFDHDGNDNQDLSWIDDL